MLPSEQSIAQSIANVITDPFTYMILVFLSAFLIYFFRLLEFFEIPGTYRMILSFVIPIILWEPILSFIFGTLGIPLVWGSYEYVVPFYDTIMTTSFVMTSKFFDLVFNFGIFRMFGFPYFEEFVKNVTISATVIPLDIGIIDLVKSIFSSWFNLFVWIYVSVDSIIDFIFFFVFFNAVLIVLFDDIKNSKTYAIGLALIPTFLYAYYISNPLKEYPVAIVELDKVFYFLNNAPTWDKMVFIGTLLISLIIVMEILALAMYSLLKTASNTIQPEWQTKEWSVNQHGVAFSYTIAFAIMYAMHSYAWYIFFPAMILYSSLKKVGGVAIETANEHEERQEMKDLISGINNQNTDKNSENGRGTDSF